MSEICIVCGLPKELCVCETIAKENQQITVKIEFKKYKKKYTIVEGIDQKQIDLKTVSKKLKNKFACGGNVKDNKIELQGDHRKNIQDFLVELGFAKETINIA
jgi:translation initiation factor 1